MVIFTIRMIFSVVRKYSVASLCVICLLIPVRSILIAQAVTPDTGETMADSIQPQTTEKEFVPKWYDMITNLPGDWLRYSQETFRTENIPAFLGIAALTGVCIVTDQKTWDLSRQWRESSTRVLNASNSIEYLGDGRPQFGLAGAFALYGFALNDRRALRTASELVEAILACGGVVQLLKHVTGRQSPYVSTEPRGVWDFFPNQINYANHVPSYDAFPSGHLSTALTTMTVVFENYPELNWMKPIGYTVIGLIGVSMVNTGIHWYSDYPLAVVLGYSFGVLVAHPVHSYESGVSTVNDKTISLSPGGTERGPGISINYTF